MDNLGDIISSAEIVGSYEETSFFEMPLNIRIQLIEEDNNWIAYYSPNRLPTVYL